MNKIPEWQKQEQLRAARRKPKKQERVRKTDKKIEIVSLCLVLKEQDEKTLQRAYSALRFSDAIRTYFERYTYHGPCQGAVMSRRVAFVDIPSPIANRLRKELIGGESPWIQGSASDLLAERVDIAERRARYRTDNKTGG